MKNENLMDEAKKQACLDILVNYERERLQSVTDVMKEKAAEVLQRFERMRIYLGDFYYDNDEGFRNFLVRSGWRMELLKWIDMIAINL